MGSRIGKRSRNPLNKKLILTPGDANSGVERSAVQTHSPPQLIPPLRRIRNMKEELQSKDHVHAILFYYLLFLIINFISCTCTAFVGPHHQISQRTPFSSLTNMQTKMCESIYLFGMKPHLLILTSSPQNIYPFYIRHISTYNYYYSGQRATV
jgi:hypothetical protein